MDLLGYTKSFGINTLGAILMEGKYIPLISRFHKDDIVGCGVDMPSGTAQWSLFFTKNGELAGVFREHFPF